MIIQIKCSQTGKWKNRCSCATMTEAQNEKSKLEKIYRFNQFQIIEGEDSKIPKARYVYKSDDEINQIVSGIDSLIKFKEKAIKDNRPELLGSDYYKNKVQKVLSGKP